MNNTIARNTANYGGGIYCRDFCLLTITNNTIAGNIAGGGGGIYTYVGDNESVITNSILWGNSASVGQEILAAGEVTISYSDVRSGPLSVHVTPNGTLNWGAGMIDSYPLWVYPDSDDFHLTWDSPCRDTGDNSVVTELYDIEGDPRIAMGTVDMGADEFYYHLYQRGDVVPGSPIDICIVGEPGKSILLAMSLDIYDPPIPTQYGDLYLKMPLVGQWNLPNIPETGVRVISPTVPPSWNSGEEYPFQVLVGSLGNPSSVLSNLMTLTVD
jgi:hypothetical protein